MKQCLDTNHLTMQVLFASFTSVRTDQSAAASSTTKTFQGQFRAA